MRRRKNPTCFRKCTYCGHKEFKYSKGEPVVKCPECKRKGFRQYELGSD